MKRPYIPPSCKVYVAHLEEALLAIATAKSDGDWARAKAGHALPNELKP